MKVRKLQIEKYQKFVLDLLILGDLLVSSTSLPSLFRSGEEIADTVVKTTQAKTTNIRSKEILCMINLALICKLARIYSGLTIPLHHTSSSLCVHTNIQNLLRQTQFRTSLSLCYPFTTQSQIWKFS